MIKETKEKVLGSRLIMYMFYMLSILNIAIILLVHIAFANIRKQDHCFLLYYFTVIKLVSQE